MEDWELLSPWLRESSWLSLIDVASGLGCWLRRGMEGWIASRS